MSRYALRSKSPFLQQDFRSFKAHRLSDITQRTYIRWISDCIDYYQQPHPRDLHDREVGAFITNLAGKGSFHSLQHTFASHAYHHGLNLRELQVLLGHSSVETTQIYTHLLPGGRKAVVSPIDEIS
jgi:integrase